MQTLMSSAAMGFGGDPNPALCLSQRPTICVMLVIKNDSSLKDIRLMLFDADYRKSKPSRNGTSLWMKSQWCQPSIVTS